MDDYEEKEEGWTEPNFTIVNSEQEQGKAEDPLSHASVTAPPEGGSQGAYESVQNNSEVTQSTQNWQYGGAQQNQQQQAYQQNQNYNTDYNNNNYNNGYNQPPYGQSTYTTANTAAPVMPQKKPRKHKGIGKKIAAALLVIVLGAGAGFGGALGALHYVSNDSTGNEGLNYGNNATLTINPNSEVNTAEAVAAKAIPSVVGISTTKVGLANWFSNQLTELPAGVGTGIIVSANGLILTNSHVVLDGSAKTITVQLSDEHEYDGKLLWYDSDLDLALVKIEATGLVAAELGDSDEVNIGSYAVAIGNPLGLEFARSVSQGVISGLNRTITVTDESSSYYYSTAGTTMSGLIQTDAAINSGNSGGPLLNSQGQVIGINSAKAASGEGMGFAIPINVAKPMIEQVMKTGTFNKVVLGITGTNVTNYTTQNPQADLGVETGVYVTEIHPNSPAQEVGLQAGDVIIAIDKYELNTMSDLIKDLFNYKSGDEATLKVVRDKRVMEVKVTLRTTGAV